MNLSSMLPRGRQDSNIKYGARRTAERWPLHARIAFMPFDGAKETTLFSGVVLNMSAGGLRVAISPTQVPAEDLAYDSLDAWASDFALGDEVADRRRLPPPCHKTAKYRVRIEGGAGSPAQLESVEVVWTKAARDGWLVGLRFLAAL